MYIRASSGKTGSAFAYTVHLKPSAQLTVSAQQQFSIYGEQLKMN